MVDGLRHAEESHVLFPILLCRSELPLYMRAIHYLDGREGTCFFSHGKRVPTWSRVEAHHEALAACLRFDGECSRMR
jgi:hypothetical protein